MSVNIFISYILYNKNIIVNLYKLYFPTSHFSLQPNKKVFYPPTFPLLQPNTRGKTKSFVSSHFSILPLIFHHLTFPLLQPNGPLSLSLIFNILSLLFNLSSFCLQSLLKWPNFSQLKQFPLPDFRLSHIYICNYLHYMH